MTRSVTALVLAALCTPALAQSPPAAPNRTDAFERSFVESYYLFDACGDALAGRLYRRALADKFAHCPFSPEARTRYQQRTRAEQASMRDKLNDLIERQGGLPVQLEGMSRTCHAQQADAGYRQYREKLEQFGSGTLATEAVISPPCDAPDLTP